ncbi:CHAT domain-containing protein [Solwaraspora sp. WMMB335]|uniref:CHAT domain-containing protein n=1 Tax=Solwaraspora sp. WMMB335 TaxID=3404118 RepID=UPI003B945791
MTETDPDISRVVDRRMALAREWDELVAQVRELEGLEDFLRPPRLENLLPAAAEGPVAIVNVSRWRCDALLVRADGVDVVPLPGLTSAATFEKTNNYLRLLQQVDQATAAAHAARRGVDEQPGLSAVKRYTDAKKALATAVAQRDGMLATLLTWLWDEVAAPVLAATGFTSPPDDEQPWPRLWWCPTGPLTLLPLHAAGYHDTAGRAGDNVLDRVVSSYAPTLRALLEARQPLAQPSADDRLLVVSMPQTPGQLPLENVVRERKLLTSLLRDRHTLLEDTSATTTAVLDELPRHRWAHFSCHGGQDLADPSRGGLLLHDRVLTIPDISARQHDGEFAFLSACKTAVGGTTLPDEAITLAAALHYTGYRRVIGTMWSVHDDTAADVAEMVYTDLTATGRFEPAGAARALHRAIRRLRDVRRLPASAWTPFTHTGA